MENSSAGGYDGCHTAVLLTGGASRRMGTDKAKLQIGGRPLAEVLAGRLRGAGWEPTVLGRTELPGYAFVADEEEFAGPVAALARFKPRSEFVFVLSCDVVRFDAAVPGLFLSALGEHQAVIPELDGRLQPLCALYRRSAWDAFAAGSVRRVFDWVDRLDVRVLDESALAGLGVSVAWLTGVNTPEELRSLGAE